MALLSKKNSKLIIDTQHTKGTAFLAALAYDQLKSFYNIIDETKKAPDFVVQQELIRYAAEYLKNFQKISNYFVSHGLHMGKSFAPYKSLIDQFHRETNPTYWGETLVKAYLGYGFLSNYTYLLKKHVPASKLSIDLNAYFALSSPSKQIDGALDDFLVNNSSSHASLILWSRRIQSETITQLQYFLISNEEIMTLFSDSTFGIPVIYTLIDDLNTLLQDRVNKLEVK